MLQPKVKILYYVTNKSKHSLLCNMHLRLEDNQK